MAAQQPETFRDLEVDADELAALVPPPGWMLSRQLEELGTTIVFGALADQPLGYVSDVLGARTYARAYEALERQAESKGTYTAPGWALKLVLPMQDVFQALGGTPFPTAEEG